MPGKSTPPSPDPKAGRSPGYAEPQPRDRGDAQRPPEPAEDPEEGGLDREADPET